MVKWFSIGLLTAGLSFTLSGDHRRSASDHPPTWSRKTCGSVCTVTYNGGGYIDEFLREARRVVKDKITLKIDGPCASACTMAADRARPYTCITKRAVMRIHNFYATTSLGIQYRGDPSEYYRVDIVKWVKDRGGFPGDLPDDDALLDMPFKEAKRFWPVCA